MSIMGRVFIVIGLMNFLLLFSWQVFAKDIQIISVKKKLQMSESDPAYRDFYINAGVADGFKKDTVFEVFRRETVIDQYKKEKDGTIQIPVGKLRVIYTKENYSVAREYKVYSPDEGPALEYDAFMIGDVIDISSASVAKEPLKSLKKKTTEVQVKSPSESIAEEKSVTQKSKEEQVRKPSRAELEPQPEVEISITR